MREETKARLDAVCKELDKVTRLVAEETAALVGSTDHVALIVHFRDVRNAKQLTKAARESIAEMEDHLSKQVIPDLVAHLKETTGQKPPFYIEGVGRVSVSYRFSCSMLDKEKGIQWLDEHGHGALAQRTVNAQTLSSFAKSMLEEKGMELPSDIFKTGTSPYTSITRS